MTRSAAGQVQGSAAEPLSADLRTVWHCSCSCVILIYTKLRGKTAFSRNLRFRPEHGINRVNKPFFREQLPSTFDAMAGVLDRAVNALIARSWITPKDEPCTRLCLEEALVNAIRHGNRCEAGRCVGVVMSEEGERCTIRICDEGTGFSPEEILMPAPEQLGGRGVCLIRHYMDKVTYNKQDHCLEMVFRRRPCCTGEQIHG